jgi:hypothetical protein
MIVLNNFEIQNNGQDLLVNVETETGSIITSVLLWNMNDFKDYSKAINLDYKLVQETNQESFTVTASEISISEFTDMWFIEIQSDYIPENNCDLFISPALGITYNISPYYKCALEQFLKSQNNPCINCDNSLIDNLTLSTSLLIDMFEKAIEEGYYLQAVNIITKLKKLCNVRKCNNCEPVECSSCSKFKQT